MEDIEESKIGFLLMMMNPEDRDTPVDPGTALRR
jgi:hypothetical protein